MKKIPLLALFVLCFSTLSSQNDDYLSKINQESITSNTNKKLTKLIAKYDFPEDYEAILASKISSFEYHREVAKYKYSETERKIKRDSITIALETWREEEISFFEKANKLWVKMASRYELDNEYKASYLNYHFYLYHLQEKYTSFFKEKVETLVVADELISIGEEISEKETERVITKCSDVQELDASLNDYAKEQLNLHLKSFISDAINSRSEITLERNSDAYCAYAYEKVLKIKEEKDSLQKIEKDNEFIANAIQIGLDSVTATSILTLIEKRKNDLQSLKDTKNEVDETAALFENTDVKTKTEIKKEFAQNLARIIDRTQFSKLFGDVFMKNVDKKVVSKMDELENTFELDDDQQEKISLLIKTFFFNQQTIVAYFYFDKKLKNQKLSALRFRFENDYKEFMNSLDLEVKPNVNINNSTYLWNN